jgi:hydrogenase maturation protein HypF
VAGVVFDGTGYGLDGAIWGGEFLVGDYASVRRAGHLRSIGLPGGDAAIKHPARTALAHLQAAGLCDGGGADTASGRALSPGERALLASMLSSGSHCTPTTSVGRLFDAISSLLDVTQRADYEGQAAIELEAMAAAVDAATGASEARWEGTSAIQDCDDGSLLIDPTAWLARAVADHRAGVPVEQSALAFHLALAEAVTEAVVALADREGVRTVGLTGGVFGNAVLLSACQRSLSRAGLSVLTHRIVPANDGGLALGQVAVAAAGGAT